MRLTLVLTALLGFAAAAPSRRSALIVHEKRTVDPTRSDWSVQGRPDPNQLLPLKVALTQQNLHQLEDLLLSVSDPESANYGQHLSPEDVVKKFSPSDDTIDLVTGWLVESGFDRTRIKLSPNRGWLQVEASVAEAERLLNAEYYTYLHPSGVQQIGCHNYSVPAYIQEHVDLVKPTVHFVHRPQPSTLQKRHAPNIGSPGSLNGPKSNGAKVNANNAALANCDQYTTPDCLRALYNIDYKPISTSKNSFGIVEFTPQAYLAADLDMFFRNFSPSLVGARPNTVLIDGAVVQTTDQGFDYNGESDLDLEYAMALVNPQTVTLLQAGDLVEGAGFDNWLDAVDGSFCTFEGGDDPNQDGIYPDPYGGGYEGPESCGIIKPPNVVSISYGQDEATITAASAMRQCQEYAKLGLMGTSVVYSSGDYGVAGFGGICQTSDHLESNSTTGAFNPGFPASCPYVTAVGATQVNPGSTVNDPESACEQVIYSGGGFSNIFQMPSYQASAVKSYVSQHLTPSPFAPGQWNNSGNARAFPDISANGANYVIGIESEFNLVFGTSAAAPVVGSIVTLLNDARLAIGKKPIGFLNPIIYNPLFAPAFNDITTGTNQGCGTNGFSAAKGWDPVTGVGTPNFSRLLPIFLALP